MFAMAPWVRRGWPASSCRRVCRGFTETRGGLIPTEQIVRANLERIFPGMEVVDTVLFRVTRDADFAISDEADDLMGAVEAQLRRRRFGDVVRLEVENSARKRLSRNCAMPWACTNAMSTACRGCST